jgi:UDP-N-acetylmuramoyl-tripeptide--D-alanyl-D-alanine ligase
LNWEGRKILVLGAMKELGAETEKSHAQLGGQVASAAVDGVFFFGEESEAGYLRLLQKGFPGFSFWSDQFDALKEALIKYLNPKDLVLLKGSRGVELERLIQFIKQIE